MTGPNEKPADGSNRAEDQHRRLLQRLGERAVSTIEARRDLDIFMPAARVT